MQPVPCVEPVITSGVVMMGMFCVTVGGLLFVVILAANAADIAKAWRTWRKDL